MKTRTLFVMLLVTMAFVSCKKKYDIIELPKIEYDVLINNHGSNYSWFDHMEGFQRIDFFNLILDNARSGKFTIEDVDGNKINASDIDYLLTLVLVEDTSEVTIILNAESLNGIRFRESWKVNSGTGEFEKEVIAFCPLYFHRHQFIDGSPVSEVYPLFWIYPSEEKGGDDQMIVAEKIAFDVFVDNTFPFIEECYGEKLPFYFCNIEPALKLQIVNSIIDAGIEKRTPVYDYFFNEMQDAEFEQIIERKDTISVFSEENPDIAKDSVVVFKLDRNQITRLKFVEQWTIDKQSLQFSKKVIAVSPSSVSYDEYGEFRGFRFLFWLLFDKEMKKDLVFE